MKTAGALLGLFLVCHSATAFYGGGFGGYGGFRGVEEIIEPPLIPVSGGLVGERSFVDSFIPGSSYCGYGTYGPAYGGLPYPLEAFGPVGGFERFDRGFGGFDRGFERFDRGFGGFDRGFGGPLVGGLGRGLGGFVI